MQRLEASGQSSRVASAPAVAPALASAPSFAAPAGDPALVAVASPAAPAPAPRPITRQWWFWTGIGVVLMTGVIAVAVVGGGTDRLRCPAGAVCPPMRKRRPP